MKLSEILIKKITDFNCSSAEINFIIFLAQNSQQNGTIYNIYYKDVIEHLGISKKHYYNIVQSLQRKQIIYAEETDKYGFKNIVLYGNNYSTLEKDQREKEKTGKRIKIMSYLNLNNKIFSKNNFYKLSAATKKILLNILLAYQFGQAKNVPVERSVESLARYAGIDLYSKKLLNKIISEIKNFLNITERKGKRKSNTIYCFSFMQKNNIVLREQFVPDEKEYSLKIMFNNFLKKYGLIDKKAINDFIQMYRQYKLCIWHYVKVVKHYIKYYKKQLKENKTLADICKMVRSEMKKSEPYLNSRTMREKKHYFEESIIF